MIPSVMTINFLLKVMMVVIIILFIPVRARAHTAILSILATKARVIQTAQKRLCRPVKVAIKLLTEMGEQMDHAALFSSSYM